MRRDTRSTLRCWLHPRNPHPQCRVRNLQHRFTTLGDDAHIGRHARQQAAAGVGKAHHGDIRHHIGHVLRRLAHLAHLAIEGLTGKGIHRERRAHSRSNAAHIGFINAGIDLHIG